MNGEVLDLKSFNSSADIPCSCRFQTKTDRPVFIYVLMDEFNIVATIAAGVIATFIKNVFLFLFGLLTRTNLQPVYLLGTLATKETSRTGKVSTSRKALLTGIAIYYGLGVLIAAVYVWLWVMRIIEPNLFNVFILGFFTGVISLVGLNIILNSHKNPPKLRITDHFSPILIGNVIFAFNFLYLYLELVG